MNSIFNYIYNSPVKSNEKRPEEMTKEELKAYNKKQARLLEKVK